MESCIRSVYRLYPRFPIPKMQMDNTLFWLHLGACMVFFMQCGFALLEAGGVRAKNTKNILLKNLLDACMGAMIWYLLGFPLAYGRGNAFIGGSWDAVSGCVDYGTWLFLWSFAVTAATIVSGAVAERCKFITYLIYTVVMSSFIYPVVVHWTWSDQAWLSAQPVGIMPGNGFKDFAGSGVVHVTGGVAALMGAIVIGPRVGRFDQDGAVLPIPGHSTTYSCLGCFILWFGWYGFNAVSTMSYGDMFTASRICVATTLAAAAGGLTCMIIHVLHGNPTDVMPALNGILAGLVSVTGSCNAVEPYAAIVIGAIGAPCYYYSDRLLLRFQVDDPIGAAPVHFFCGAWGVLAVGLFSTEDYMGGGTWGLLFGGSGLQLGIQLAGLVAIAAWSAIISWAMFKMLARAHLLRVIEQDEVVGLDVSHHGGPAYHVDMEQVPTPRKNQPGTWAGKNKRTLSRSFIAWEDSSNPHPL